MSADHHLALSVSAELWNEMLRAALPFQVAGGELSLRRVLSQARTQLAIGSRVRGLLADKRAPPSVQKLGEHVLALWHERSPELGEALAQLIAFDGTWQLEIDDVGTDLHYGQQKVALEAALHGLAEGDLCLLRERIRLPVHLEKRVGASVALGRVRYAPAQGAIIANLQDVTLHLGEQPLVKMLIRVVEVALAERLKSVDAVEILKRAQVESMVAPMGQSLRMQMGVESLALDIHDGEMTLKVKFGFGRDATEDRKLLGAS